ncbi:SWIB/MDM2 domain-containing protein [Phenylobacterium immobile]|jgi:chromatin remodeling complex protein RSC6|uniref:SWIB/MDM2 domain-containing protein n=1 Tax=Phenylobacterium immobile TaxID=21 RepID=UPI000A625F1D|nr:SWIB/MDM2 domain-containing protein [Phenylobacterium immobile]
MAEPKKTNALQKPLTPSPELAAVVGSAQLSRGEVVSKIWDYIKKNNLQNPANKREILADDKLKPVFDGKPAVSMFEMNKHLAKHLK